MRAITMLTQTLTRNSIRLEDICICPVKSVSIVKFAASAPTGMVTVKCVNAGASTGRLVGFAVSTAVFVARLEPFFLEVFFVVFLGAFLEAFLEAVFLADFLWTDTIILLRRSCQSNGES